MEKNQDEEKRDVLVRSFRLDISFDDHQRLTVKQVVHKLQKAFTRFFPKFQIARLAITPNLKVCYVKAQNRSFMPLEFQRDFGGLHIVGTTNQQRTKFNLILGRAAIIYNWSHQTRKLETTDDDSNLSSSSEEDSSTEPIKKIKTEGKEEIKVLINKVNALEQAAQQKETEFTQLKEVLLKFVHDQNKRQEEILKTIHTIGQQFSLNLLIHQGDIGL